MNDICHTSSILPRHLYGVKKNLVFIVFSAYSEKNLKKEKKRMSNNKFTKEKISDIQKKLKALPPKDKPKTKKETLEILSEDFPRLLEKGYSIEDISKILKENGLQISAPTLRNYLPVEQKLKQKNETTPLQVEHQKNDFVKQDISDL